MSSIGGGSGPSLGGPPSVGGDPSVGPDDAHNDDPDVTHDRGRIDDMVRHLGMIRGRLTPENTGEVGGFLDDADAAIEKALDALLAEDDPGS